MIPLSERIYGRTALEDIADPATGAVIVAKGECISVETAEKIEKTGSTPYGSGAP